MTRRLAGENARTMTDRIRLNGEVVGWDCEDFDEDTDKPLNTGRFEREDTRSKELADQYRAEGWSVETVEIPCGPQADTWYLVERFVPFADGTVQIQPKLDTVGRSMVRGRHANVGYSGRFVGYVYLCGKRKRLVDWWTLFPLSEHHYEAQKEKPQAEAAIRQAIEARAGTEVVRVPRGYAFDPVAYLERMRAKAT